jgi:hypothetical protein
MIHYRTDTLAGIEEGLAARIADPLWLLARQSQFAEFTAEESVSPVYADVELEVHPLDHWRPVSLAAWRPYDPAKEPLEQLVEQEAPAADARLRLEGGLRLWEMLREAGFEGLIAAFANRCRFERSAQAPLADAIQRRIPDGVPLADMLLRLDHGEFDPDDPNAIERTIDVAVLGGEGPQLDAVLEIAPVWLEWWDKREPSSPDSGLPHPPAWDEHRLEYAFEARASTLNDTRLVADGYTGGRLDWWAVDAGASVEPEALGAERRFSMRSVPAPARFGGMPVPRLWEMEDAQFDPGATEAAASDLGRLLLVAFATVYGNDWFVLPVRLPVGSLTRVTSFVVTDVFGGESAVGPAGAADDNWNLFSLTKSNEPRMPSGERATSPWFYMASALPESLESRPLESVALLRDEMANLAWAVERLVTDDSGQPLDRAAEWAAREPPEREPGLFYRAATQVPDHWYPLAPEKLADLESIALRLLPLRTTADDAPPRRPPLGRLLARAAADPPRTVWLHEEELPRSGAEVVRTRQHARWHDGKVHLWTGRRKSSGRGEGASGLRFDVIDDQRVDSGGS